jgi:hypothetical protein
LDVLDQVRPAWDAIGASPLIAGGVVLGVTFSRTMPDSKAAVR